mgnify:CR=1
MPNSVHESFIRKLLDQAEAAQKKVADMATERDLGNKNSWSEEVGRIERRPMTMVVCD